MFAGIYAGTGIKITATLSDGSAASVIDTSITYATGPDPRTAVYTIDYAAASAGQTLTVLVQPVSNGTLSVQGGALGTPPAITVPGAPTIGSASAGSKSASVGGTGPASNGGSPITGYRATSNPGGLTGTGTALPVNVGGLTDGTAYTFTLAAQNSVGYGPESAASNSVTPSSVNNPPTFPGGSIPNISGQAGSAITPVDVHGYFQDTDTLIYSASPGGTAWPSGLSIDASTGVISGTVATAGTTTGIRVRATDTASQSVDSNAFNVVMGSGPTQIPFNDPAIVSAPYVWDTKSSSKSANTPGAYMRIAFTGTSIAAAFDVAALAAAGIAAGSYPIVTMVIDSKFATDTQLSSSVSTVSRTGLASGAHTLDMFFRAVDVNLSDRWTTPVSALVFKGFTLDAGASYSAPAVRSKNLIFSGDSITEGYFVMPGQGNPGSGNSMQTVTPLLALALGCEYGQLGYSAQGYEKSGNGNVPALYNATLANSPVNFYSAGRSRLVGGKLSPEPDYVCIMHGANGTTTSTGVQGVIDAYRAIAPNAHIFVMVPAGGYARTAITAGVAARSSDAKVHLIDLGAEYQPGMDSSGTGSLYSYDNGLHPNLFGNARASVGYVDKIQAILDGGTSPVTTARTFALQLGNANGAAANLSGLSVWCFDQPSALAAPVFRTTSGTTDASGNLSVVAQSTLAAGGTGFIVVRGSGVNYAAPIQVA